MEPLDPDAVLAAQERVLQGIYEDLLPSVVHIRVSVEAPAEEFAPPSDVPFGFPQLPGVPRQGVASGFVWNEEGQIVTNYHVIAGAERVTVIFADGSETEAEVLGSDPDSDLAVLRIDPSGVTATPGRLGDSDAVRVGQLAVAIGSPFGQEYAMTSGIVSGVGRTIASGNTPFSIHRVIQTDAPINPGNSGELLLDREGRVIGINTQIVSRTGTSAGVGFAVPINTARRVVPRLIADGSYDYAWLRITGATLRPAVAESMDLPADTHGALVVAVVEGSPPTAPGCGAVRRNAASRASTSPWEETSSSPLTALPSGPWTTLSST